MHEHVSDKLPQVKIRSQEKVKTQHILYIHSVFSGHKHSEETEHIDNKQVFRYCWKIIHIVKSLIQLQMYNIKSGLKEYVSLNFIERTHRVTQHQQAFRSHIEQQVNHTEIRQKAQLLVKHLIIRLGKESLVRLPIIPFGVN